MMEGQELGMTDSFKCKTLLTMAKNMVIDRLDINLPKFRPTLQDEDKFHTALNNRFKDYVAKKIKLAFIVISNEGREYSFVKNVSEISVSSIVSYAACWAPFMHVLEFIDCSIRLAGWTADPMCQGAHTGRVISNIEQLFAQVEHQIEWNQF